MASPVSAVLGADVGTVLGPDLEEKVLHWSPSRLTARTLIRSKYFEACSVLAILAGLVLLVFEVNADAKCFPEYLTRFQDCPVSSLHIRWLEVTNTTLLLIYSAECVARAYVDGSSFLCICWNLIDLATVAVGWAGKIWVSALKLNFLRAFRLLRICRGSRLVLAIPELYFLVLALCACMKAFLFALALVGFVFFLWAIVTVQTLHPVLSRSPAFADVWSATVTLASVTLGAREGTWASELVEQAPWTALMFFAITGSVVFGVANVILVLFLECAVRAYEKEQKKKAKQAEADHESMIQKLADLCSDMDIMKRGSVSVSAILRAYQEDVRFRQLLEHTGIEAKDQLERMCVALKPDYSSELRTSDFLRHLRRLQRRDPMQQARIEYSVLELRQLIKEELLGQLRTAASPLTSSHLEESPSMEVEALRKRWARHCLKSFEVLQGGLQPLLAEAEKALSEVLEDTGFEPPSQDCRIDIDTLQSESSPDVPSRTDWLLDQRSAMLVDSFRESSAQVAGLQDRLATVVQRLNKLRSGFDGRTESL